MTKFDFNEGMAMIVLGVIACGAMYYLGDAGKDIVLTVAAGIVGYISRGAKEAASKPEVKATCDRDESKTRSSSRTK